MYQFISKKNINTEHVEPVEQVKPVKAVEPVKVEDFPALVYTTPVYTTPVKKNTVWTKLDSSTKNSILEKLKEPFPDEVAIVPKSKDLYTNKRRERKKEKYDSDKEYDDDNNEEYVPYIYNDNISTNILDSDSEEFV